MDFRRPLQSADDTRYTPLRRRHARIFAQWLLPLLLAKQSVQGIVWDGWQDNQPHEMPASGLIDAQGQPKPALQTLAELRRAWLG